MLLPLRGSPNVSQRKLETSPWFTAGPEEDSSSWSESGKPEGRLLFLMCGIH